MTACMAAAICLSATGPTAVWRHSGIGAGRAEIPLTTQNALRDWMNTCRRHIVWEADGRESSVAISTDRGIGFVVNGKSDGSAVQDVGTQIMLGVLGALLHPQPREGLVIGLGTGESAGWLAHQPAIEHVDVVEIEPAIRQVADICAPLNHEVLGHSKVHITYNDAREALLTSGRHYDVIASEPSNPYRGGVSSLYTREFYEAVRSRLKPDGLFLQWLQGYEINVATVAIVLKTLKEAFGHVEIWETSPGDLVLVASIDALAYTAEQLRRRMDEPAMRDAVRIAWRTTTLEGVFAHLVATDRFVEAVLSQAAEPANIDDRNVLEYRFARTVGLSRGFTVSGLRAEAVKARMQRPTRLERDIDWEAVEDARIAYYAASGDEPLSPTLFTGDRAKRAEALAAFQTQSRLAAVARLWDSQPKPPNDLLETLALSIGAAAQGEERAMKIMGPIRALCPVENDFVIGLLAYRQQRPEDAAGALAIMFKSLRSDPTPLPLVVEHAVRTALEIGSQHPQQIPVLFNALREPFALRMAEESRTRALCLLASSLGPREIAEAMEQVEPNPWWNARMLEMRVQAYATLKHPLLSRAQAELSQFKSQAGDKSAFLEN